MTYTYLADGTKQSARILGGGGLRYSGSFVYAVSVDGSETLESVGWDEGRICFCENEEADEPVDEPINGGQGLLMGAALPEEPVDSTAVINSLQITDQWFVRDHLGNVRSVVDLSAPEGSTAETALVEQSDYLPFGTRIAVTTGTDASDNRYRYAGKEEQRFGTGPSPMDLEHLDFGARFYDPFTARFTTPDPLASKYPSISPYAYCANDPVNKFDPDGRKIYDLNGNVVTYDSKKGWSSNASPEFIEVASFMQKYHTGSQIINDMLSSQEKFTIAFIDTSFPENSHKMGENIVT